MARNGFVIGAIGKGQKEVNVRIIKPAESQTIFDLLQFRSEYEKWAESKNQNCHALLLFLEIESSRCFGAVMKGLESFDIVPRGAKLDFVSQSQATINHFFREGEFTLWATIQKYVLASGKELKSGLGTCSENPLSNKATELITRLYGSIENL